MASPVMSLTENAILFGLGVLVSVGGFVLVKLLSIDHRLTVIETAVQMLPCGNCRPKRSRVPARSIARVPGPET